MESEFLSQSPDNIVDIAEHVKQVKRKYEAEREKMFSYPGKVEDAIEYSNRISIMKVSEDGKISRIGLWDKLRLIGNFSVGLFMYFEYLKYLTIFFLFVSLISIIPIAANSTGDGLYDSEKRYLNAFLVTSLANLPNINKYLDEYSDETRAIQEYKKASDPRHQACWISDLIYSVFFFFLIIVFRIASGKLAKTCQKENLSAQNYTLEVVNIPQTITADELKRVFSNFGEIVEVNFSKQFSSTLGLMKNVSSIQTKVLYQEARLRIKHSKRKEKKLAKLAQKLQKARVKLDEAEKKAYKIDAGSIDDYPSLTAYVIFKYIEQRDRAFLVYKKYNSTSFFFKLFCSCCLKKFPDHLKMDHEIIPICELPDNPSNILWENKGITRMSRIFRTIVVLICLVVVMVVTFLIIFCLNLASEFVGTDECDQDYVLSDFTEDTSLQDDQVATDCFCSKLSYVDLFDSSSSFQYDLCYDYRVSMGLSYGVLIGSAVLISLSNNILKITLVKLSKFERYTSLSHQAASFATKLFFATVINTAFVTLLYKADLFGFSIMKSILDLFGSDIAASTSSVYYDDFSRTWYRIIGLKILNTMIIAMVSPHLVFLAVYRLQRWWHERKKNKKLIQVDLNKVYTPPVIEFEENYSVTLRIITVCFAFSSGIPILNIVCFIALATKFWSEWFLVTRWRQKPQKLDETINERVLKLLPIALVLHLGFGVYMYGAPDIFYDTKSDVLSRIMFCLYLSLFFAIVLLVYSLDLAVFQILRILFCGKERTSSKIHPEDASPEIRKNPAFFGSYYEVFDRLAFNGVYNFDLRQNPYYSDSILAINDVKIKGVPLVQEFEM